MNTSSIEDHLLRIALALEKLTQQMQCLSSIDRQLIAFLTVQAEQARRTELREAEHALIAHRGGDPSGDPAKCYTCYQWIRGNSNLRCALGSMLFERVRLAKEAIR